MRRSGVQAHRGFGQCGGLRSAEVGNLRVREPGDLIQELPDSDVRAAGVGHAELRKVGVDRVVQGELADVDELHQGEGGNASLSDAIGTVCVP